MPLVSIIIPVCNAEQWLRGTLDSVLAQTLTELEILCVDDGSRDGSADILREYAGKDPRVRLLQKENGGLSSARNAGLSAARGNYIYFLDADDLIAPGAMETAYRTARENDLDMLLFGCAPSFESREVRKQQRSLIKYYRQNGSYPGVTGGEAYFNRCVYFSDFVSTVSVQLVKRSFLAENRLGFFDGILHEDNPYTFLCLMYAKRVMRIPDVLFIYRVRAASITTARKGGAHIAGLLRGIWLITEYETKREADLPAETSAAVNILKEKLLDQAVRAFSGLPPGAEEREADFFPAGDPDIAAMFLLLRKLAKERDREWGRFLAFREKAFRYLRERKRSMT